MTLEQEHLAAMLYYLARQYWGFRQIYKHGCFNRSWEGYAP